MNTRALKIIIIIGLALYAAIARSQSQTTITPVRDKARVYVTDSQSWEVRGGWGLSGNRNANGSGNIAGGGYVAGGTRPQTAEIIKTFNQRCQEITITNNVQKADFAVTLDHEGGKGYLRHRNKIVVFNKDGDAIFSDSTRELGNSVKDACQAILSAPPRPQVAASPASQAQPAAPPHGASTIVANQSLPIIDASIDITSTPSGADVELDGNFVGNTPSSIGVSPGDHAITVKKSGYKLWERKIKVSSGKVNISAELEAEANQISAGRAVSGPPASQQKSEAAAPEHSAVLVAPPNGTATTSISQNLGAVSFTSDPAGAEVYVDNLSLGKTPITLNLKIGPHYVRMFMNDYKNWSQLITVAASSEVTLAVTLEKPRTTQSVSAQTASPKFLRCRDWSKLSTEMSDQNSGQNENAKISYLEGLQYGYTTALEFVYRKLLAETGENPDEELDAKWSTYLSPRSGVTWDIFVYPINLYCSEPDSATKSLAEEAVTVLTISGERPPKFGAKERNAFLESFGCSQYNAHPKTSFVAGYRDGQRFYWSLLDRIGFAQIAEWKNILSAQDTLQFEIPTGKGLDQVIGDFCSDSRNKNISFDFAAKIAALQARGENEFAEALLEPYYCTALQPVWANGRELRGKSCLGVTVLVDPKPVFGKPLSYMVGVTNHSDSSIEVDWTEWSLSWKSNHAKNIEPALDPDKIIYSLERRSLIAGSLAAFGASMSASVPRTAAVISGPGGTSTVTVYPSPGQASAAASEAASRAEGPGMKLAGALSDYSVRRTTLPPNTLTGGTMVYFAKPKDSGEVWMEMRIPGLPKFSLQVDRE